MAMKSVLAHALLLPTYFPNNQPSNQPINLQIYQVHAILPKNLPILPLNPSKWLRQLLNIEQGTTGAQIRIFNVFPTTTKTTIPTRAQVGNYFCAPNCRKGIYMRRISDSGKSLR